jgi:predicted ATPase
VDNTGPFQPFVGRDAELATVVGAVAASREGRGRLVLIGGESGVGKTRVVREALHVVEGDTTILFGSALDITEKRPFSPIIDALRHLLEDGSAPWAIEATQPWHEPLSRLLHLPLANVTALAPQEMPTQDPPEVELLSQVIAAFASISPLVLVVEDLQWADRSTRDLLVYVLANLIDTRLTIIATYRSEAITRSHPLRQLLPELVRNRRSLSIELKPVDRHTIDQLVTAMSGEFGAEAARVAWQRSEGNFFVAGETLRSLDKGGGTDVPATLRQIVLGRIDTLSPEAQQVLHAVAAAEESVSHEILAVVVSLEDSVLLDAVRVMRSTRR